MSQIILPIHLLILAFIVWNIVRADHLGWSWVRGKISILDRKIVQLYYKRVWIGLCLMVVTGVCLFWPLREFLLERQQFYVKMTFITILIINGFAIGKLQRVAETKTFASLSLKQRIPLFVSGAISTLAWLGAIFGGLYLIPSY